MPLSAAKPQTLEDILKFRVDPKFNEGSTPTDRLCEGCFVRKADHIHHMEHKGMGGRKRKAKQKSEDLANKTALCMVCHSASHFIPLTMSDGFCCAFCPQRDTCYYGARTLNRPYLHLTPRW